MPFFLGGGIFFIPNFVARKEEMKMRRTTLLLLFLLSLNISAQESVQGNTLPAKEERRDSVLTLKEVTVSGARIINKTDRQIVFPTQAIIKQSTNGYDLLKKMMLPAIRVDEVNQSISSTEGSVQIRINDVKAEKEDILSLQPDEVLRVEYIDNPGVRYNEDGLAAVINYIVKRRYAGYVGGISTMQAFTKGFNNSSAYFKYNHKKSEFSLAYNLNYRDYDKQHSDDHSIFLLPDGTERHINYLGFNNTMAYNEHNLRLGYNLAEPDKYTFNVRLRLGWSNAPYSGSIQKVEETGKDDLLQYNRNSDNGRSPSLDLYYSINLPHKQTLAFNAVGTYIGTDYKYRQREYLFNESLDKTIAGNALHDYSYQTDGKKYSLISEAVYTKELRKKASLSGGFNYNVSRTDNKYTGGINNTNTVLNSNNLYAFAQLQGQLGIFNYQLGAGANYISIEQDQDGFHKWTFRPQATISTNAIKNINIRYTSRIQPQIPSLASLSEIRKQSSTLAAQDGNASLKPYNVYDNALRISWNIPLVNIYTEGRYRHMPSATMNSILPQVQEDGSYLYIWKPENQRKYDEWTWQTFLTLHLIKDVLDLQGGLGYEKDQSRGLTYSHDYDCWTYYLLADLTLGKWNFSYGFGNSYKTIWGEDINGGENTSNLDITYKSNHFKLGLGCLLLGYAQGYNYTHETNSRYYKNSGCTKIKNNGNMVYLTFSYNFSHGRKYNPSSRILNNEDRDNGIR